MASMDVDVAVVALIDENIPSAPHFDSSIKAEAKRPVTPVRVDDAHPFDLEMYNAGYSGRTAILRLLFIIEVCPTLARDAFRFAVQRIKAGRDVQLYRKVVKAYNNSLPGNPQKEEIDEAWVEKVNAANMNERNKLEVELKTYTSNMIKESIRMAHRDLGNFYRDISDGTAFKHYTKSREFCTASQHVLDSCLSILELLIEERDYLHISTYVYKADATLDVATSGAAATAAGSQSSTSTQLHKKAGAAAAPSAEREKVQTKLDVATALSHLGQGNYERAAITILRLATPKTLEDWYGKIITPSDIAIYGALCALATMSRRAITAQLLENETFAIYLEHEPYVRELVNAYMGSKFKTVLDLLERYSARHYLDIHLSAHVHDLVKLIRDRALVLYFQPFASVKLHKMASAFGLSIEEIERLIVGLIESGSIKGRVDGQNKVLKACVVDQRAVLFARAAQAGANIQATNRQLLLRMRLQQADLVVRPPKTREQGQNILFDSNGMIEVQ